ncbi:osteopetrosis-associated transmembrane protein 1 [Drosophila subpulchrella]|uniref:osteopetrosis-associated transmembrane protein 1 n=1 Tax=Drosophila subpulchrella TaxID=1486046 RepID=UPI0018A128B6|nr:osteopetrosis-associated transmembrane protein 1 [Drosophila subpulchrella]
MPKYIVFVGFFLTLSCQFNLLLALKNKTCEKLLGELGDGQSKFIYCATTKSVPVNLCLGCEELYRDLSKDYDNLIADANCSKRYLNSDRINIVATTQGILTSLWQKAHCENCFTDKYWAQYENRSIDLQECLETSSPDVTCVQCKPFYLALNDLYLKMESKVSRNVCFDLQDNMNRTRLNWSKTLNCCQREVKLTNFLIAVGVVVLLPILTFYITAIVVTKRREANHGLLNDQEPELDAPSTSRLITAAVLSTPVEDPAVVSAQTEKIANVLSHAEANQSDDSEQDVPSVKQQIINRAGPVSDYSSDEEPLEVPKVLLSPESDYSSDDEPLTKPKRA